MENKQQVDFIIVGQGLAGTLLSYFLLIENQRVVVFDHPHDGRTSHIAAGLVNPVTGRRIAKSWRFEELAAFAKQTYQALELKLGGRFWNERPILRALHSVFEENEWMRRSAFPEFEKFMDDSPDLAEFDGKIQEPHAWGELKGGAQLAMPQLVEAWRNWLTEQGVFFEKNIDYQLVALKDGQVEYEGFVAKKLIFCEGGKAVENPFFQHLPFLVTKGELLLIRVPGLKSERILKHKLFLVPMAEGLFWAGSTSRYEFEGPNPTEAGKQALLNDLEKTLKVPFEVVHHLAGVRPTVADLRPFLGLHSEHPELAIFNGLGTKGALQGPFFAKQMADFLSQKTGLEAEVDIRRFEMENQSAHFFKKMPADGD